MYPEDLLPYESDALPETHPSRCGAIARLFGLETQAIETARVLELGCASGTNLLGMAASLPEASFVGVDLSSPAIAEAESRARRHNLSNITFHCLDLNELPDSLGSFDYIIAHGLFSWVDRRTQTALLQAASNHLAPNGLLYLSYNVLPGWHLRLAIREIVLMETAALSDPRKKLQHARGVMGALAFMWERQKSPTAQAGVKELELL